MKSFLVRSTASTIATALLLTCFSACKRSTSPTTADETPDTSTYKRVPTPATEFAQKLKFVRDAPLPPHARRRSKSWQSTRIMRLRFACLD